MNESTKKSSWTRSLHPFTGKGPASREKGGKEGREKHLPSLFPPAPGEGRRKRGGADASVRFKRNAGRTSAGKEGEQKRSNRDRGYIEPGKKRKMILSCGSTCSPGRGKTSVRGEEKGKGFVVHRGGKASPIHGKGKINTQGKKRTT